MRVKLTREASIKHKAGEIVEVSPAECAFLTDVGAAVLVEEKAETVNEAKPTKAVKPVKKVAKKK